MRTNCNADDICEDFILTSIYTKNEDKIEFSHGIPGFESIRYFTLFNLKDHELFHILKSDDEAQIELLTINVRFLKSQSEITISKADMESIGATSQDELELFVILKIDHESGLFTANMRAPIIINLHRQLGRQVILEDKNLPITHPLIPISS